MTLVPITPRRCYVCGSRDLGTYERESRALAAVSLEALRSGDYGPCWRVGERGNVSLVHYW